ncbi:MAG: hypothetical protein WCB63_19265, partial [Polyangiales bacterium]
MQQRTTIALLALIGSMFPAAPAAADDEFADGQTWGFEISFGAGWAPETEYTRRLEDFGYSPARGGHYRMSFAVEKILLPYFS